MTNPTLTLALDRDPANRYYDSQGFLHVRVCNISKSNVCPYRGNEIPGWEELGLDPQRVYQLHRDPEELAKAADTFNGLPLFDIHKATSADTHPKQVTVGATGTEATFKAPYLQNALVIWTAEAIAGVETRQITELSCGYAYDPDMTPGVERGLVFDGVMRNLRGNHVALVEAGRAGPDVVVGDSKLEIVPMPKHLTSKKALFVRGALSAITMPLLAADAQIDLNAVLEGVNRDNYTAKRDTILSRLTAATKGKLATDASLEPIKAVLIALDKEDCGEDDEMDDDDDDDAAEAKRKAIADKKAKDKKARDEAETAAEKAAREKAEAAEDKAKDAKAMDAAITAGVNAGLAARDARDEAVRIVRPIVGEVTDTCSTAASVYKFALDARGVDLTDVPEQAFKAIVKNLPSGEGRPIALDAKARDSVAEMFPGLARYAA